MEKFRTHIKLSPKKRQAVIDILNQHLVDTIDLYTQTKQAHWNVKGMHFIALHELFDKLAEESEDHIDDIAERVTALGGVATGTSRHVAAQSRLPEIEHGGLPGAKAVEALVERYGLVCVSMRAAIDETDELGDAVSSDLLTGIVGGLDKNLWFLEAHLQKA